MNVVKLRSGPTLYEHGPVWTARTAPSPSTEMIKKLKKINLGTNSKT